MKQKLFTKKSVPEIGQNINDNAAKVKGEPKQKGRIVLEWIFIIIYLALLIYFVFKPLMEFMLMVEYNFKLSIIKYFIN